MQILKQTIGLLLLAGIIGVVGQFLPGVNVLFDNYLVGFLVAMITISVVRMIYKLYMIKVAELSQEVMKKRMKEGQEWWEETSEATHSPSRVHDPRNIYCDD